MKRANNPIPLPIPIPSQSEDRAEGPDYTSPVIYITTLLPLPLVDLDALTCNGAVRCLVLCRS